MNGNLIIKGYCRINKNQVYTNGKLVLEAPATDNFAEFTKAAFRAHGGAYLKFFKMDSLCKLGFLCNEYLLTANPISEKINPERIGIVLSNSESCLATDVEHQKTIADSKNYFPSPSVFVYTLPNILIGEICIKQKFRGENTFFIFEKFNPQFLNEYINGLFLENKVDICITGWVETNVDNNSYNSVLFLIEKSIEDGKMEFTADNLMKLYNE